MKPSRLVFAAALLALLWPVAAYANVGIPMLALAWPVHWIALIPVVLIESELACRRLGVSRALAYKSVATANLASTLFGIPVAWGLMLVVNVVASIPLIFVEDEGLQQGLYIALFPLLSAWIGPVENTWVIYAAFVCLAPAMWYASVLIEHRVIRSYLPGRDPAEIQSAVIRFNLLTYGLILAAVALYAAWASHGWS